MQPVALLTVRLHWTIPYAQSDFMDVINSGGIVFLGDTKLGSDCTGSDGAVNRTLTADHTIEGAIVLSVQGASLHEGAGKDFTVSGNVITFLNAIDNTDNIRVVY